MAFIFPTFSAPESPPTPPTNLLSDSEDAPRFAVRAITSLLRTLLRITTNDGRVFIGTFAGTDQPMNILLLNTEEYRMKLPQISTSNLALSESELEMLAMEREARADGRYVGQVLIPWRLVVKIEAQNIQ